MERFEETRIVYKCPPNFQVVGPRPSSLVPRLALPFVTPESATMTNDLISQVWEFLTQTEDRPAFLELVQIGLSEAVAKCSRAHRPETPIRAILIRQDILLEYGLTFVVDCIPDWRKPIIIPNREDVPSEFCPNNLTHLGYRRMIDACDGLYVDFIPNAQLMFTLTFLDPRP